MEILEKRESKLLGRTDLEVVFSAKDLNPMSSIFSIRIGVQRYEKRFGFTVV